MTNAILEMSTDVVTAHLAQNRMSAKDVPNFIRDVHKTLSELSGEAGKSASLTATRASETSLDAKVPEIEPTPSASAENDAAETSAAKAAEDDAPQDAKPENKMVAYVRDNDLSDPVFEGLDPYLAARISPRTAAKLDPNNEIHPTVFPNHIICLEDGQICKLLRTYINNRFQMTPEQYIEKWNLPDDYPMTPPEYQAKKRAAAKKGGLGKKVRAHRERSKEERDAEKKAAKAEPKRRGRPPKNAAKKAKEAAETPKNTQPTRRKLSIVQQQKDLAV